MFKLNIKILIRFLKNKNNKFGRGSSGAIATSIVFKVVFMSRTKRIKKCKNETQLPIINRMHTDRGYGFITSASNEIKINVIYRSITPV